MPYLVAHNIENVESVHLSTSIKPKISLKAVHKNIIRNNGTKKIKEFVKKMYYIRKIKHNSDKSEVS